MILSNNVKYIGQIEQYWKLLTIDEKQNDLKKCISGQVRLSVLVKMDSENPCLLSFHNVNLREKRALERAYTNYVRTTFIAIVTKKKCFKNKILGK